MKILVINGPNLNMLGKRDSGHYGNLTYDELCQMLESNFQSHIFEFYQSNDEGELINRIQEAVSEDWDGLLCNFGGLSHTSVVIRDAVELIPFKKIEVHLSNIHSREEFRHTTLTGGVCNGIIAGFGPKSYELAVKALEIV